MPNKIDYPNCINNQNILDRKFHILLVPNIQM